MNDMDQIAAGVGQALYETEKQIVALIDTSIEAARDVAKAINENSNLQAAGQNFIMVFGRVANDAAKALVELMRVRGEQNDRP